MRVEGILEAPHDVERGRRRAPGADRAHELVGRREHVECAAEHFGAAAYLHQLVSLNVRLPVRNAYRWGGPPPLGALRQRLKDSAEIVPRQRDASPTVG